MIERVNEEREGECRRWNGRAFHCTGPAQENALSPKDFVLVGGMERTRSSADLDVKTKSYKPC